MLLVGCGTPPAVDDAALQADLAAGRSGAEVTFHATLSTDPARIGSHEQMQVQDAYGDRLEIDYNTDLGPWVPARGGQAIIVRGQLYIDSPTRIGVHCVHAKTSLGCPIPGFIRYQGTTYQ
ncbi:MAG TPA: hypothetical protein VMU49_02880 [Candidatus Acidoferrales bacterium]|nr:hypothetical protein [Candidatus Acidoferrales bacterium]